MSDMKCPFCNTPLVHENMSDYWCVHCNTQEQKGLYGSNKLWQELIRTRKALDVAIRGLEKMTWGCDSSDAEHLLKEITALEQKDVK